MSNTTFSGPVRSEGGFQTITIAEGTGTETITSTIGATTSVTGTVTARSGSALVAGGASVFIGTNTANSMGIYFGSGAPTVSAAQGSLYLRSDGNSTSTRAYVNTNGTTGWAAITTAS